MLNKNKVVVLLACRNGELWIGAQIDSILAQQGVEVKIIIQDDCSTDRTRELIAKYTVSYPGLVEVVLNDVGTGSAGANFRKLISHSDLSDTNYVALADQDDIWHHDKLSRAIKKIEEHGCDGYSAAVQAFWPDKKDRILRQTPRIQSLDFIFEGAGQGCTFVLPVAKMKLVQRFCLEYPDALAKFHFHDWLIYILTRAAAGTWYFDQQPVMRYRQHANNDMGARGGFNGIKRRISLVRGGWYKQQVMIAQDIYRLAGGHGKHVDRLRETMARAPSLKRRLDLAALVISHARRRMGDRLMLTAFALLGWL